MGSTSCAACGAAMAADVRCPSCGASALQFLELPPVGGAPPPSPPSPPPVRPKTERRPAPPERRGTRAFAATLPRSGRLDLPEACVCCDGEAGVYRIESAPLLAIHVPYCKACRGHHRRPPLRAFVWFLSMIGLGMLGWTLNPVEPDSFGVGAGLALLLLVASRALSYVLVPRLRLGGRHAREGRSLWIRGSSQDEVSLAVCRESYLARLGASNPRPIRELRRALSTLLFGSVPVLQPLAVLAIAAGLLYAFRPVPADERAYRVFRQRPSLEAAERFTLEFRRSRRTREMEEYIWAEAVANPAGRACKAYVFLFPKGKHRGEADLRLEARELSALMANPTREGAAKFLKEHPTSARLDGVRDLMLAAMEGTSTPSDLAPPLPVLREIVKASPGGKVTLKIAGFQSEDYGRPVEVRLKAALKELGLAVQMVKEGRGVIEVEGANRLNKNFSYSRFGLGGGGPYGEVAEATVKVVLGEGTPMWSARVSAKSPATVSYTTFRVGSSPAMDTGPSQYDVHSQTIPVFEQALKPLFEYR